MIKTSKINILISTFLIMLISFSMGAIFKTYHSSILINFAIIFILSCSFIFFYKMLNPVFKSIKDIIELLKKLENGEFSIEFPEKTFLKDISISLNIITKQLKDKASDNNVIENLNNTFLALYEKAVDVTNNSSHVAKSSDFLLQSATNQAASLQEISGSMVQIGSQTKTNAENAYKANQLAKEASDAAKAGVKQMEEMMSAISSISDASIEIARIIKTIDNIAFQTNLLALNAAVEAARAGKHGRGFTVVAQEVRNLAVLSAKAAKETAAFIESSAKRVNEGRLIAMDTSLSLDRISEKVFEVSDLFNKIAESSKEQAQGIAQVNQGLSEIGGVTQNTTENANQTSQVIKQLFEQALEIKEVLSNFRIRR
ncbi:MAG: hypothetical protein HQK79_08835 [Desulfobacterales bacterium]|nr:hypothetical protein [Desulfobacterales bacterium]